MTRKVLDLFSGSGSVANYCKQFPRKFDVTTLDSNPKFGADIVADVLKWNYKALPKNSFDLIWASPPCTEYSLAKTIGTRNYALADSVVKKTLQIIDYFQPDTWFLENPKTGFLKTRPFMRDVPYYDVCYCKYGYPYKKPTRIWTNLKAFEPLYCHNDCPMVSDGKHRCNLSGKFGCRFIAPEIKAQVPPKLIRLLFRNA